MNQKIVYFDFETAGLTDNHPNIQLAAIAVDSDTFEELDSFEAKIQFDESKADPEALKINHYSRDVWEREAKTCGHVTYLFCEFLKKLPASFHVMDTLHLAFWFSFISGNSPVDLKLTSCAAWCGISCEEAHDALADVRFSAAVARTIITTVRSVAV
ncbi:MAG: hypothetical protein LC778_19810 [Acidobacteria bacterium]|nr:hypothetical protein [Acidobacteriota bacterium]